MKTAVIYARYSSDSQTEQSIEGQVRVCKQFAEKNDLLVVDSYIDRATTGTNDNRAAFQQMLRDSKKAQWGAVIVYKLDRFARNKYESVVNRKKLKDNGVELVSAMENIPDTPEGKLFLAVIEGFNEYFSEDLKQKVNRGLRESWLKGNATGGHPPFGYVIKDKKYIIDEAEAEIVREIFMKYAQGYKAVAIAEDLKARNIRRKCGKHINHKYVYVILHDKRYIGEVTHQGTTYYNIFPPIIAKEVWNQVDAINQENKISPSRKKEIFDYILSGKLICGNCKHRMSGESGTSRNGEIHYYYVCLSKRRGKADCDCKAVKKQELEDYVIDATVSMLQRNSIITQIAETIVKVHEKIMRDNSGLQILIKKRDEAKRAADNIVKAIEQGIIMDFTKDRLAALQDELNRLDIEINKESQKTYAHVPFQPELWRKGKNLPKQQGLILGCEGRKGHVIAIVDTDDIHAMVTAASGAGKTAYFLYPNIEYALATGTSFLCTDTKGDLFRNYAGIAKENYGFQISVLDLRNPTRSDGNNLLHLINRYMDVYKADPQNLSAKAKAEKYAKVLSKTLINTSGGDSSQYGQNAYFYDAAEGLLSSMLMLVAEYLPTQDKDGHPIEERHIVSVFKLVQELLVPSQIKGKNQYQLLMDKLPENHKAKMLAGTALTTSDQAMKSVISTVLSRLNAFLDSEQDAGRFCAHYLRPGYEVCDLHGALKIECFPGQRDGTDPVFRYCHRCRNLLQSKIRYFYRAAGGGSD